MRKKIYMIGILMALYHWAGAQDVHYAQFHNVPLYQSPALSGVMPADFRLAGVYRMQWESVPVRYRTFGFSYDMKAMEGRMGNGVMGLGLVVNRDIAGDSRLSLTTAAISLAYTQKLSKRSLATVGFNIGGAQRAFDPDGLTFDQQFNGDIFDPDSETGEIFENRNYFYLDMGAGANYRFQINRRTKFDLGASGQHFNLAKQTFREDTDSALSPRFAAYLNGSVQFAAKADFLLRGIANWQGPYTEYLFGGGMRYHLGETKNRETAVSLSAMYRWGDAIAPVAEVEYGPWIFGFSYDLTLSDFTIANNRNGGPELTVIYMITKVRPIKDYKACPIF